MIFVFKVNHSMHNDDDDDNDDILFVSNIGIAKSSVCATGRGNSFLVLVPACT